VAVARRGQGADASATLGEVGLAFNISLNQSEGRHQATRTLIEMSAIQIVGKLTRVPYWRCLQIEQTNPQMVAQARDWFSAMSQTEQVAFVQRALAGEGYYNGAANGQLDASTKGAVSRYQAENGLLADGRIDFDLYQKLIGQDLALGTRPATVAASVTTPEQPAPAPLSLRLASANGTSYRVADSLELTLETTQDSYVYCFYRDARGAVSRIFPNQFRPDPYVIGGQAVQVPSESSPFSIVFDQAGAQEEVACIASYKELGMNLPTRLKVADLTPMPVQSIDDVVGEFKRLDQTNLAEARLRINVAQ
jgi:peptidoglycan hydrolase-like protein with peptidoglycan-binding domain